jgi:hypothetical protein
MIERISDFLDLSWVVELQDLLCNRPGVFGIGIYLAAAERFPENDRAAHSLSVLGWYSAVEQSVPGDFAEHIGFGEFFRTDDDGFGCRDSQRSKNKHDNKEKAAASQPSFIYLARWDADAP